MKLPIIYFIVIISTLISCTKEREIIKEVPDGIIRDTINREVLYQKIDNLFPEQHQMPNILPSLFSDTVLKKIVITEETEVFITFILESASYKNTVGWYSYNSENKPKNTGDINMHILFPNVSGKGEGGELLKGDMLQLGESKFSPGTVIGFFLIIDSWNNGEILYSKPTHYTDYYLNKGAHQQHVLFKDKVSEEFVLGFEDEFYEIGDRDFNDILLIISDNKESLKSKSFDLLKLPIL